MLCNVIMSFFCVAGQRLLKKICGNDTGQGGGGGGGGVGRETDSPSSSTSESDIKNVVLQNLEAIHSSQQHLLQLWHHKKLKLDQCFQLRLFEQDCEKVYIINGFVIRIMLAP